LTAGLGGGAQKWPYATQPMNGTLPKTYVPTASSQKPKQPLDSTRPQSAETTKKRAATADMTRAKGEQSITTGAA